MNRKFEEHYLIIACPHTLLAQTSHFISVFHKAMQSFANKQQPPLTVPHDPKQRAHAAFTLCHN